MWQPSWNYLDLQFEPHLRVPLSARWGQPPHQQEERQPPEQEEQQLQVGLSYLWQQMAVVLSLRVVWVLWGLHRLLPRPIKKCNALL